MATLRRAVACSASASAARPDVQPVAIHGATRRGVLLGGMACLAGLSSPARAASTRLADLTRPVAAAMDADGDGVLDVDELRGALQRRMGVTVPRETVLRDIVRTVDFDDDARVSVDEFARGLALDLPVDESWMRSVGGFAGGSGAEGISAGQLEAGLGDLGKRGRAVLPAAFDLADADRNGRLNQAEAANAMRYISFGVLGDVGDE